MFTWRETSCLRTSRIIGSFHSIAGMRPRLVAFEHINPSYDREDVILDAAYGDFERTMIGWVY